MTTTLSSFLSSIASQPQAALVFKAEGADIRPEYHVTEVKLAHIRALDCGRGQAEWDETLVQLLDGPPATGAGGKHMSAGKFGGITKASLDSFGESARGELFFEFAPANAAARKFAVHRVEYENDVWTVHLGAVSATCKPASRQLSAKSATARGCCATAAKPPPKVSTSCVTAKNDTACCSP